MLTGALAHMLATALKEPQNSSPGKGPPLQFTRDARMSDAMDSLRRHPQVLRLFEQLFAKDPQTFEHCHRVGDLAQAIGAEMGLSYQERVEIYLCGLLHDIGKVLTPDSILKKPGPLTAEEFAIMRLHPEDSAKMVASSLRDMGYLAPAIRGHHERIDGKGYPDHLAGDSIPLHSRVVLVADTFDAMTHNRIYRKQLDLTRTIEELHRCSGSQFDPEAVRAFLAFYDRNQELLKEAVAPKKAA